eukprot:CAMPEP_0171052076 /NCGR_PEP_ID=MMETSP0736-20130129/53526_1 /TAXON_ID=186038 /ORGANISM="Fragilariopsis kerguelensis, Strain L26-C5" /LENGTH=207 /DNA_ID=CAMNT_0011505461 /DNA_START=89 /DNA_END=712 /DNA_ORIENTATION=+
MEEIIFGYRKRKRAFSCSFFDEENMPIGTELTDNISDLLLLFFLDDDILGWKSRNDFGVLWDDENDDDDVRSNDTAWGAVFVVFVVAVADDPAGGSVFVFVFVSVVAVVVVVEAMIGSIEGISSFTEWNAAASSQSSSTLLERRLWRVLLFSSLSLARRMTNKPDSMTPNPVFETPADVEDADSADTTVVESSTGDACGTTIEGTSS